MKYVFAPSQYVFAPSPLPLYGYSGCIHTPLMSIHSCIFGELFMYWFRARGYIYLSGEESDLEFRGRPPPLSALRSQRYSCDLANGSLRQNSLAIANAMAWRTQSSTPVSPYPIAPNDPAVLKMLRRSQSTMRSNFTIAQ